MELLIAFLVGLLGCVLGYQLLYRRQLSLNRAEKRVADAYAVQAVLTGADPRSPEYRLAAAGLRAANPRLTWWLLNFGPAPALAALTALAGFPPLVVLGAAGLGLVAPGQWLQGRAKERGRRIDRDLPQVYVELLAILRAGTDVPGALTEVANGLELDRGPSALTAELRLTAQEAALGGIGPTGALQNLQARAASVSLANLGRLLERYLQTGAGQGGRFFEAFAAGAANVQSILEARQRAQAKAADSLQSARLVPVLLAATLLFFMSDAAFRAAFSLPLVQLILAGAAAVMYLGYLLMGDMVREAV